jgi:hypothetical protein
MSAGETEKPFSDSFREELRRVESKLMVHKYIISGDSRTLPSESYYKLRVEIADWFGIHPNEVIMVGSGKLGFSIDPSKMFHPFRRDSDYDIAILSSELFDFYWRKVFAYSQANLFWKERDDFNSYLVRGWVRPDLLPSNNFEYRRNWWAFFGSLSGQEVFGRRFLGRKTFFGAIVILVSAMRQGPTPRRVRELSERFRVDPRTIARW